MAGRPLQYEPLKVVLQYMEANLRFQLSLRCPSIRVTEKLVPLKIDTLTFGKVETKVNNTTYQLGMYRHYPPGVIPIDDGNHLGGEHRDVDRFGFSDFTQDLVITPGDVDLRPEGVRPLADNERQIAFRQNFRERGLRRCEIELEGLQGIVPDEYRQQKIEVLEQRIAEYRRSLQPFYRRHNNILPLYTQLIELKVDGASSGRVSYNKKLHKAVKYLRASFFGGRTTNILVKKLVLKEETIYRFPADFTITVRNLECRLIEFELLNQIIHPSSYAAVNLILKNYDSENEYFNQYAIKNAKSVSIDNRGSEKTNTFYEALRQIENQSISLFSQSRQTDPIRFVENWLQDGKGVGAFCSFGVQNEQTARTRLNMLTTHFAEHVKKGDRRFVTFSMPSGNSQLRAFYERTLPRSNRRCDEHGNWKLVLKVESL